MLYEDKLKDPRWKKFAKKVYARDDYRCTFDCNVRDIPLVAHHKLYYVDDNGFVEPWDYSIDDLQTLCKSCHDIYHKLMGFSVPIYSKKTGKIINEDEPTRRTRLVVEKQLKVDRELRKKEKEKSNETKGSRCRVHYA